MKSSLVRFLALALTAVCACAPAQPPQAIDPLFTAAPASLSVQQVGDLQHRLSDWAQLGRYRAENARLPSPSLGQHRVVFYGDSITDAWGRSPGTMFFPGKPYVNRGIAGQTTAQMLLRFRQDVIDLHPAVVVILAGTNDLAGNTGVATTGMIEDNLRSMTELARWHGIRVVLASVLPVLDYPWHRGLQPAARVRELNVWMRPYAARQGAVYLDYYDAMVDAGGGLQASLSADGVHPTAAGYAVMAPLAEQAIARALASTPASDARPAADPPASKGR